MSSTPVQSDQDHAWKKSDSDVGCCCYQLLTLLVVAVVDCCCCYELP